MKFLWPEMLWFLLVLPALAGIYVLVLRRRKKSAVRYASLALVKEALGPAQRVRRHLPPALLLLALAAIIVAMARPSAVITLPSEQRTIILAIDVSLSMRASDIQPSRLAAAQAAAKAFIQEQPSDVRIGIVSFAGTASLVQPPTRDRDALLTAIDQLQLQRHTAIGSGLIVALAALLPEEGIDLESILYGTPSARDNKQGVPLGQAAKEPPKPVAPMAPGTYASGAIILLTDGRRTMGPDPVDAARMAAERGVRVYTVGFGTAEGGMADVGGWSIYMRFDEEALKAVADITKAEYFYAGSGDDLRRVYGALNARFVLERKETEISALATAVAAVLAIAAAVLSLLWFHRVV